MKSFVQFNKQIFGMKFPWNLWVGLLAGVNMVGGAQCLSAQLKVSWRWLA